MRRTRGHPPLVWLLVAAAGLVGFALGLGLPWRDEELRLDVTTRAVMALAGTLLLGSVARASADASARHEWAVGALGASVLAYPTVLAVAAAEVGGSATRVLASAWHVVPLTLVQLAPLLAGAHAVGRTHRRWERAVLVVAGVGAAVTAVSLAVPGSGLLLLVASLTWFGSFAIAPVGTWVGVRGTSGEVRRRALVAALASLVPVVVITGCVLLGLVATTVGTTDGVTLLMLGFSAGTLSCGLLSLGAGAPQGSPVLHTATVVATMHALLAALSLVVGALATLSTVAAEVAPGPAVVVGMVVALATVLPWWWLHRWTLRVVDPASEVRHELARLGPVGAGGQRLALLHVLRRVVGDGDLELRYDPDGSGPTTDPERHAVVVARSATGSATVVATTADPAAVHRLRELGDVDVQVEPALLEARVEHASLRAEAAAQRERTRLSNDLHDGLQGRLLGLALHLQLGARDLGDPAAALLAEEAVTTLRAAVEDVRALGGGRLPDVLVRDGLAPALAELLRPLHPLVGLELPAVRFGAVAEAAAYFVVAEAVTNAVKHATAHRVEVRVRVRDDHRVEVLVRDDGCGGADPRLGRGLRGLAERVAAVGGVLVVRDAGPGTAVEAVVPCAS